MSNRRQRLARLERLAAGRQPCPEGCLPWAIVDPGEPLPTDRHLCPRCGNPAPVLVLTEEIIDPSTRS